MLNDLFSFPVSKLDGVGYTLDHGSENPSFLEIDRGSGQLSELCEREGRSESGQEVGRTDVDLNYERTRD